MPKPLLILLIALSLTPALSQREPNFLLLTTPEIRAGGRHLGTLTEESGQNFKDGSRLEVVRFTGSADDAITLRVESNFDSFLTLYAPDNSLVAYNDDDGSSLDATLTLVLEQTGTYVVIVSGYSEADRGAFTLSMVQLELQPGGELTLPSDTLPTEVVGSLGADSEVDEGRYYDLYSFTVEAPTRLVIDMQSETLDSYLALYRDGELVAENDDGTLGPDAQLVLELLPGTYELRATSFAAGETGLYRLSLSLPD